MEIGIVDCFLCLWFTFLALTAADQAILSLYHITLLINHQSLQAGFSHNNISSESIFITPDGEWKLGRLDCVRRFADNNMEYMRRIQALLSDDNVIPSYEKQVGVVRLEIEPNF